jgi:hypothetical protein
MRSRVLFARRFATAPLRSNSRGIVNNQPTSLHVRHMRGLGSVDALLDYAASCANELGAADVEAFFALTFSACMSLPDFSPVLNSEQRLRVMVVLEHVKPLLPSLEPRGLVAVMGCVARLGVKPPPDFTREWTVLLRPLLRQRSLHASDVSRLLAAVAALELDVGRDFTAVWAAYALELMSKFERANLDEMTWALCRLDLRLDPRLRQDFYRKWALASMPHLSAFRLNPLNVVTMLAAHALDPSVLGLEFFAKLSDVLSNHLRRKSSWSKRGARHLCMLIWELGKLGCGPAVMGPDLFVTWASCFRGRMDTLQYLPTGFLVFFVWGLARLEIGAPSVDAQLFQVPTSHLRVFFQRLPTRLTCICCFLFVSQ